MNTAHLGKRAAAQLILVATIMSPCAFPQLAKAGERHVQLIATTPCLEDFRWWRFVKRGSGGTFPVPDRFTAAQCATAAKLSEQIDEELEAEKPVVLQQRIAEEEADARVQTMLSERLAAQERKRQWDAGAPARRAAAARDAARRLQASKPDVRVGMSPSQVLEESSWGHPDHVNRTRSAAGVEEQWVYSAARVLYFRNGLLVVVQD